ncbi:hypothetical protein ABW20_dc0109927 [Dactylellina cionopaga]|nr:hypothetical protein ABW20_dc0109927 [Dactylellina cionopaga]
MQFHRNLFFTASRVQVPKVPSAFPIHFQYRRQSTKPPVLYPAQLPKSISNLYNDEFINFYKAHLAGKPRYNPFEQQKLLAHPGAQDHTRNSPTATDISYRDVILPRKATGSITLRVYNSTHTDPTSPVIVYFPSRGTNPIANTDEHHALSYLTHLTRATTVSVGYRISPPFPLSLHDCLAAVDWVRKSTPTVNLETYADKKSGRLIALLGTGLGGSLATSIGITEGRESGIIAAGAWAPVMDWAFDPLPGIPESHLSTLPKSPSQLLQHLAEFSQELRSDEITVDSLLALPEFELEQMGLSRKMLSAFAPVSDNPFLSTEDLKTLRSHYLPTPEDFTDPFVSPLYWFSSSGVNIWTDLLATIESENIADPDNPPEWIQQLPDDLFKRGPRRVKSYPPLHLIGKLTVPMMRIVSADGDILHNQTKKFVHAARSSLFPKKTRTLRDLEREESAELELRYNNDKVKGFAETDELEDQEDGGVQREESGNAGVTTEAEEVLPYSKTAKAYIQHIVVEKAGHCLITGAGDISDGRYQIVEMANWLSAIFKFEPLRAKQWRAEQERIQERQAEQKLKKRRKGSSKL